MVQAAWAIVVGHLTGRADVVFGASVAGRPADLAGMEGMLGLFINTVPVRVRLTPGHTIARMLTDLQAEQTDLLDHHYLSLSDIQRHAGSGAVFDTMMAFESFGSGAGGQKPAEPNGDGKRQGPRGVRFTGSGGRESINYPLGLLVIQNGEAPESAASRCG